MLVLQTAGVLSSPPTHKGKSRQHPRTVASSTYSHESPTYKYNTRYRIGDLVYGFIEKKHRERPEQNPPKEIFCQRWPKSIGCAFTKAAKAKGVQPPSRRALKILCNIAKAHTLADAPPTNALVVHLRLGDVLDNWFYRTEENRKKRMLGCNWWRGCYYVNAMSHFTNVSARLAPSIERVIILGNSKYRRLDPRSNYSEDYVARVIREFERAPGRRVPLRIERRTNGTVDDDFAYLSRAHTLVPSPGSGFSRAAQFCALRAGAAVYTRRYQSPHKYSLCVTTQNSSDGVPVDSCSELAWHSF
jgi:hypothetical protein